MPAAAISCYPEPRTLPEAKQLLAERDRQVAQMSAERSAIFQVLANPHLKAQERITSLKTIFYLAEQRAKGRDQDGWVRVPLAPIAEGAGCSTKRASVQIVNSLVTTGILKRRLDDHVARAVDAEGEVAYRNMSELYFQANPARSTLELMQEVARAQPPEAKAQGGKRTKRPTCPDHPEAGTVERWHLRCAACDRPLDSGERHHAPDDPDDDPPAPPPSQDPATTATAPSAPATTPGGSTWPPTVKTEEGGDEGGDRVAAGDPGGPSWPPSGPPVPVAGAAPAASPRRVDGTDGRADRAGGSSWAASLVAAAAQSEPVGTGCGPGEEELVARLWQLAGDRRRHIRLRPAGPAKYEWERDGAGSDVPLTAAMVRDHLAGAITVGAELVWAAGRAFAVCWDADNPADFALLHDAARRLAAGGARPVLERSPSRQHPGGGRLWLFFPVAIEAGRAWATALTHAPALARLKECWPTLGLGPTDRGQAVRLPAGVYRRDGLALPIAHAAWRAEGLTWVSGRAAAALTLSERTPATWLTEDAPPPPARGGPPATPLPTLDTALVSLEDDHPLPAAWSDPVWLARYGAARERLACAITEREAIAWYNARHDVRQLLPKEANGYGRAVWRDERTPSVGYLANNCWIDFGARGRRAGGRRDGGDAFELLCRLRGLDRRGVLAQVVAAMREEAHAELLAAARTGQGVPGWVAAITAPAGWRRYARLRGG